MPTGIGAGSELVPADSFLKPFADYIKILNSLRSSRPLVQPVSRRCWLSPLEEAVPLSILPLEVTSPYSLLVTVPDEKVVQKDHAGIAGTVCKPLPDTERSIEYSL